MKTNLLSLVTAIACLCIYACDVDYDPPAIPATKTSCIHVTDGKTGEPLDSVLVEMTLRYTDPALGEYDEDFFAHSDNHGDGCVTYDKGSSLSYEFTCTKPGYTAYSFGEDVNWFYIDEDIEVKLFPLANVRFHVKNEVPNADQDYISIVLPGDEPFSVNLIFLSGSNVDTTFVKTISPGHHNLTWTTYSDLTGEHEVTKSYFFNSNTTTDIEILY